MTTEQLEKFKDLKTLVDMLSDTEDVPLYLYVGDDDVDDFIRANTPKSEPVENNTSTELTDATTMTNGRKMAGVDFNKSQNTRSARLRLLVAQSFDYLNEKVNEFSRNDKGYDDPEQKVELLEDAIELIKEGLDKAVEGFKIK